MTYQIGTFFRALPDFRGKQRLVRLLLGRTLDSSVDLIIRGKYDSSLLVPNLIENIGFELFVNGVFEKEIVDFVLKVLPENGVFIDLGANIGSLSVAISKKKPGARIFSVEASPFVIPYLRRNIELNNLRNIVLYEAAVSDKDDDMVEFFHPDIQFGKGAVTNLFDAGSTKVRTITIDSIVRQHNLAKVDLMKVDIEGFEIFAFRGADKLLNRPDAPSILFEFVAYAEAAVAGIRPGDAQQYLQDKGYHLFKFNAGKLERINEPVRSGYAMIWATKRFEIFQG